MRRFPALVIVLCAAQAALASQVRPLNLEELTQRADRIFTGRCTAIEVAPDAELGRLVTTVTMAVTHSAKGDLHGKVVFKVLGSQDADKPSAATLDGVPLFRRGEEVLLFLYANSRHGLTSPVGFGNGKFALVTDKQGHRLAINALGNEHLFTGLSKDARAKIGRGIPARPEKRAIPVDEILGTVRSLSAPAASHAR